MVTIFQQASQIIRSTIRQISRERKAICWFAIVYVLCIFAFALSYRCLDLLGTKPSFNFGWVKDGSPSILSYLSLSATVMSAGTPIDVRPLTPISSIIVAIESSFSIFLLLIVLQKFLSGQYIGMDRTSNN
jgi:hypothetical protein